MPKRPLYKNLYVESNTGGSLRSFLKWQLGLIDEPYALFDTDTPHYRPTIVEPNVDVINHPDSTKIHITWIGHASFLIQYQGINILTDPVFSKRASPFQWLGPKRVVPPGLSLEQLPPIDAIVISHNHYDHLDHHTVKALGNAPYYFIPLGLKEWFAKRGISNVSEQAWWEHGSYQTLAATSVPVQHFSGRSLWDRNQTQWAGWVIELGDKRIFFAGDTGYAKQHFVDIYEKFGAMDLALIPIGAYHPRYFMKRVHVNPDEAVRMHQDLRSKQSIGMHWGTFKLTSEPMSEPPRFLAKRLAEHTIPPDQFRVLAFGETAQF